jgi:hypothetical protein
MTCLALVGCAANPHRLEADTQGPPTSETPAPQPQQNHPSWITPTRAWIVFAVVAVALFAKRGAGHGSPDSAPLPPCSGSAGDVPGPTCRQ